MDFCFCFPVTTFGKLTHFILLQISMKGTIKLDNTSKLPVDSLTITISGKDGEGESW